MEHRLELNEMHAWSLWYNIAFLDGKRKLRVIDLIEHVDVDLNLTCINEGLNPNDEVHYQDGCLLWLK